MNALAHHRMRRAVDAYADGELDPAGTAAVGRHLEECWGCSGDYEILVLLKGSLGRMSQRRPEPLAAARLRRWAGPLAGGPGVSSG